MAFGWVHRAAVILRNRKGLDAAGVRRRDRGLIAAIARHHRSAGRLAGAFAHFRKVTRSYWPGLFHCYDVPDLPCTNNALEQYFGSARYHERRATGRKGASPGLVVRGAVRVVAAVASRNQTFVETDLRPADLTRWRDLRRQLATRQAARCAQRRFRRDPAAYLAALEEQLLQ